MRSQFYLPNQVQNQPQTWTIENFAKAYLIRHHSIKPEIVETIIALANIGGRSC